MNKEYTREELELMSALELCMIACELNLIDPDKLLEEIFTMRGKDE